MSRVNRNINDVVNQINENGIRVLINSRNIVEELHNSRPGVTVQFYEIPLNGVNIHQEEIDRVNREREQERLNRRRRIAERVSRYPPGDNSVWRDRRTRNQDAPASTNANANAHERAPASASTNANANASVNEHAPTNAHEHAPAPVPSTSPELETIPTPSIPEDDYIQRQMEERELAHTRRINSISIDVNLFVPEAAGLFNHAVVRLSHVRLSCEINDPCYSCAFRYLTHGLLELVKIIAPSKYRHAMSTFHRGREPTLDTDRYLYENGFAMPNKEVEDYIFDFTSIVYGMFNRNGPFYREEHTPIWVNIDANRNLYFNSQPVCTMICDHGCGENGLIYLNDLKNCNENRAAFETEKHLFEIFKQEMWYILLGVLRSKFRMFNEIPNIRGLIRRTNSSDRLDSVLLSDGRNDTEFDAVNIMYQRSPFRNSPRLIQVQRKPVRIRCATVGNNERILKHKNVHKKKPMRFSTRIDYRDRDINNHEQFGPYIQYRPVCVSRYIIHNNIDKFLSEDDTNYID